jgi:hypothetical protein
MIQWTSVNKKQMMTKLTAHGFIWGWWGRKKALLSKTKRTEAERYLLPPPPSRAAKYPWMYPVAIEWATVLEELKNATIESHQCHSRYVVKNQAPATFTLPRLGSKSATRKKRETRVTKVAYAERSEK